MNWKKMFNKTILNVRNTVFCLIFGSMFPLFFIRKINKQIK